MHLFMKFETLGAKVECLLCPRRDVNLNTPAEEHSNQLPQGHGSCWAQPQQDSSSRGPVVNLMSSSLKQDLSKDDSTGGKTPLLLRKLGQGSFGAVYEALHNGQLLACKVQSTEHYTSIVKEFNLLKEAQDCSGCPLAYEHFEAQGSSYLTMELLWQNLEQLRQRQKGRKFSLATSSLVGLGLLKALRQLHQLNILHRDIKPENVMAKGKGCHQLKLVDFGLAERACPLPPRASSLVGNARFASAGMHNGVSSKRDDLESLVYLVAYLAKGRLPWQDLPRPEKGKAQESWAAIRQAKEQPLQSIFADDLREVGLKQKWWRALCLSGEMVRREAREVEPNYRGVQAGLTQMLAYSSTGRECFDWCEQDCAGSLRERVWGLGPQ